MSPQNRLELEVLRVASKLGYTAPAERRLVTIDSIHRLMVQLWNPKTGKAILAVGSYGNNHIDVTCYEFVANEANPYEPKEVGSA